MDAMLGAGSDRNLEAMIGSALHSYHTASGEPERAAAIQSLSRALEDLYTTESDAAR